MSDNAPIARFLGFAAIQTMPTGPFGSTRTLHEPAACPDHTTLTLDASGWRLRAIQPDHAIGEPDVQLNSTRQPQIFDKAGSATAAATGWRPG